MRFDICIRARPDGLLTTPLPLREFFAVPWKEDEMWGRSLGSQRLQDHLEKESASTTDYSDGLGLTPRSHDEVVWTLGWEQCWIATRNVFSHLATMVYQYGRWGGTTRSPFSSEHFFHQFCKHHGWAHWTFQENGNPIFNTQHPGNEPVLEDPWVFSLIR
jgi:hypothetical protein